MHGGGVSKSCDSKFGIEYNKKRTRDKYTFQCGSFGKHLFASEIEATPFSPKSFCYKSLNTNKARDISLTFGAVSLEVE